jgi:small-conductance mechanosensitive channel
MEILIGIAAGAAIVVLLHLVRRLGMKLCKRDHGTTGWATIIGRAVARTGNFFIFAVAAKLVVRYSYAPEALATTVNFFFVVAAVFQAAIWVREIILGVVEHRTQTSEHGSEALGSAMGIIRLLVTVAVFAIALIVVLDNLGVNVTGLVAGLGVGGIAIGLAAQGIFSDLFAALSILFDKPFRRGDTINYDTSGGTVEAIGLKTTRLRAITGEERIISNAQLLNKEIFNMTRLQHRRVRFTIGVIYQTPPETCARLPDMLKEIVEAQGHEFIRAGFIGFGASSLDYEVDFDVMDPEFAVMFQARHAVGIAILDRFNAEGIEFAYPTTTNFTAAPDGTMVMPYPDVQRIRNVQAPKA